MAILIALLTVVLVLNCLFLILLVLIQLPKKEAGAGLAFGGAATDALFGSGSGNALTKATKYAATLFLGLSLVLSIMNSAKAKEGTKGLQRELEKKASAAAPASAPAPGAGTAPSLNAPAPAAPVAKPATNPPAAPGK